MEIYPILLDGELAGKLTVEAQGPRTVFTAECPLRPGLIRISVYGQGKEGYLGVLAPEEGMLRLCRRLSRSELREFPAEIALVSRSGLPPEVWSGETDAETPEKVPAPETPRSAAAEEQAPHGQLEKPAKQKENAPEPSGARELEPPATPKKPAREAEPAAAPQKPAACGPEPVQTPQKPEACEPEPAAAPQKPEAREPKPAQPPKRPEERTPECPPKPEPVSETAPASAAPAEPEVRKAAEQPERPKREADARSWYASPDGALVCFDGVRSLIALPVGDARVPKDVPGEQREIEGRTYLVYETREGRIVR